MRLAGWGRFPHIDAELIAPRAGSELQALLRESGSARFISRGAGRSYGDSALAGKIISSRFFDHFIGFDKQDLVLHGAAGLSLGEILQVIVPHGAFLPVLPGTQHVTLGGAIAADIHGKNHHVDGSFCDHLEEITLQLANGDIVKCSAGHNTPLFRATCGGMGLTGVIVDARIRLMPVPGEYIRSRTLPAANLGECLELLEEHNSSRYAVAWIDCLAHGEGLGRGLVYLGEHDETLSDGKGNREPMSVAVPFSTPGFLLNRYSMGVFNSLYFHLQRRRARETSVHYKRYFFPLDRIEHWNRLYGRKGFLQYQLLLPMDSAAAGIEEVLRRVSAAGLGSFLAVLKQFGAGNRNFLSFPRAGITLALDFKYSAAALKMLNELDDIVMAHGGRLYLAKDARMSEAVFKAGYPDWREFVEIKQQFDPHNRFVSLQAQRLGLVADAGDDCDGDRA